jgi:hypothetical protein
MTVPASGSSSNSARRLIRILGLCRGSLATFVPTNVVGPRTSAGTAAIGEATNGEGEENSSTDNVSPGLQRES